MRSSHPFILSFLSISSSDLLVKDAQCLWTKFVDDVSIETHDNRSNTNVLHIQTTAH